MSHFELPELDRKATQREVEKALAKYRLYKYLSFDEREASITANYQPMDGGRGNAISDQTSTVAIFNVDEQEKRKKFCERVEKAVSRLPMMERRLIEERYMSVDSDYITDLHVYNNILQISPTTYSKIRWKAFYRLALNLNVAVLKNNAGNIHDDTEGRK